MENNINLILAQLHMEEEKLLLAGLTLVQAQQRVSRRSRQRRRRRWGIKPYLKGGTLWTMRKSDGRTVWENREDYKTFIRIKPDQFQEFVVLRRPYMAASFFTCEKRP